MCWPCFFSFLARPRGDHEMCSRQGTATSIVLPYCEMLGSLEALPHEANMNHCSQSRNLRMQNTRSRLLVLSMHFRYQMNSSFVFELVESGFLCQLIAEISFKTSSITLVARVGGLLLGTPSTGVLIK